MCAKGLNEPGVNSLQTDQLFAERFTAIIAPSGRLGCILPTGIATGAGGQHLFGDFVRRGVVASLFDFENRKPLFPNVDARYKFCLLSLAGKQLRESAARFAFFLRKYSVITWSRWTFAQLSHRVRVKIPQVHRILTFLLDASDLDNVGRMVALNPEEIELINPNTGTLPIFRNSP